MQSQLVCSTCVHACLTRDQVGANSGDSLNAWYTKEGCWDLKPRWKAQGKSWPGIRRSGCRWEFPLHLPLSMRQTFCAYAFEPNPSLAGPLRRTALALEQRFGVSIHVYNGTAFSTENGKARFHVDSTLGGVGSSLLLSKAARSGKSSRLTSTTTVETVDALSFLSSLPRTSIALKVDVEGYEHLVLRDLLLSGVLCERVANLWVEWHTARQLGAAANAPVAPGGPSPTSISDTYRWMLRTGFARHQSAGQSASLGGRSTAGHEAPPSALADVYRWMLRTGRLRATDGRDNASAAVRKTARGCHTRLLEWAR